MNCPACSFDNQQSAAVCANCTIALMSPERRSKVQQARDAWIEKLIDLTARNRLLHFKDTKTGSLDLSGFDHAIFEELLTGASITLARLIPNAGETESSARAKQIRRAALVNLEERGLETLFIALGFAACPPADGGSPIRAPVLLVPIQLDLQGREGRGMRLKLGGDLKINEMLLYVLEREHGVKISPENLLSPKEASGETPLTDLTIVSDRLRRAAAQVKAFQIAEGAVLSNFAYRKMAMVRDLRDYLEELVSHDFVASLAGDSGAQQALRENVHENDPRELDLVSPDDEFLVLNADSSQQSAIADVLLKQNVVIQGPPGTGKSQTIANLIAELAARGRRVLFVAEKRAALEVVLERLKQCQLAHLALGLARCRDHPQVSDEAVR